MKRLSRREFLRAAAAGLSAAAIQPLLAACSPEKGAPLPPSSPTPGAVSPSPSAAPSQAQGPTATPGEAVPSPTATSPAPPDLVVARGGEPEDLVRRAIAALGGMQQFVPQGATVVVKPNICVSYHTYEYAATTNPWVVAALVKLCLEAGAKKVQVFDYPFGGTLEEAYVKSGIAEQVQAAGGEMTPMPGFKYVAADIPQGVSLKTTKAFQDALEADVMINVPIAKTHSAARLTLGMKNMMGLVQNRAAIHVDLKQRIPDLASLFRPRLTVVDAVRILTANGPSGGNLDDVKKLDTVIASPDMVAADSYAVSLFGMRPADIDYIPAAAAMGLGRMDLSNLRIEEIPVGG